MTLELCLFHGCCHPCFYKGLCTKLRVRRSLTNSNDRLFRNVFFLNLHADKNVAEQIRRMDNKWTYRLLENNFIIVSNSYKNHHTKFEIDRTILTCLLDRP